MKLRKGDKVRVMVGKDKGKEGVIDRVYPKQSKVLIMGMNIVKKHMKKSDQLPQGGIIEIPKPIDASKVMYISKTTKKPTRIGFVVEGNKKFRVEKSTGERIK